MAVAGTRIDEPEPGRSRRLPVVRDLSRWPLTCLSGCLQTASDVASKDPPNAYDAIRSVDLAAAFSSRTPDRNSGGGATAAAPASYFGTPVEAASELRRPRRPTRA